MAKPKDRRGGNEEAARIILADPERYAGLPLEWACPWMKGDGTRKRAAATAHYWAEVDCRTFGSAKPIAMTRCW
jgi:hypothetical protein